MKRAILKHFCIYLFFIALVNGNEIHAQVKDGVFYSVTKAGMKDTSWLFGTYHLINDAYLTETPNVVAAFQKSKQVVVEVIIDSSQLMQANSKSMLQNKQLAALLHKGFIDSLDAELKTSIGQGIEQFQSFKPMTVMLTLSMIYLMKDNQTLFQKYKGIPLDASFVEKSKLNGKVVMGLETLNEQMDLLFNNISDEEQAMMLQYFLRNKEKNVQLGNELLQTYLTNDLTGMYAIYKESLTATGDMDFLIKNRNDNWMKILPTLFSKQSNFVAVGALHLAGPDGLVMQLQKLGFTVTPQKL